MIGVPRQYAHATSEAAGPLEPDAQTLEIELDNRLDDRTVAYVLKVRACFDSLRQAAGQLAGLLVLAAAGARSQILDLPMLEQTGAALHEAEAMFRSVQVPPSASHHYFHLSRAAEWIGEALQHARKGSLRNDDKVIDETLQKLRAGWQEMHFAANALPGFQVVNFSQACCAVHADAKAKSAAFG